MIEQTAVVVAVAGDMAEVEAEVRSACGTCNAEGACSTALLARYFGRKRPLIRVYNGIGAEPGDRVVVGMPEGQMLAASVLAYLMPLVGLIGGAIAGAETARAAAPAYEQGLSILSGFGGLGFALLWLRRFNRGAARNPRFLPRVLRRAAGSDQQALRSTDGDRRERPASKETR